MNKADVTPESVYTAPHEAAPHPEWWHAYDSDSTEVEVIELVAALVRAIQPEYVVETGSAFGYCTVAIAQALESNQHGYLVSLETDPERVDIAQGRLQQQMLTSWAEVREQSSLHFTPDAPIDFAFFDSLYELRAEEYLRYYTGGWLLPGTVVTFHDWTSGLRGHYLDVRAEVRGLAERGVLVPVFVRTPRGLVIAEVT